MSQLETAAERITSDETRSRKRRRLEDEESFISFQDDFEVDNISSDDNSTNESATLKRNRKQKRKTVLSADEISKSLEAVSKTGVIYLSRIPPRLSPQKLRELLVPYGSKVLRVFLAPETTAEYTRRIKSGGSKKKQFKEGWVEFEDKKVAKKVAEMLNAQRIGGKKGDFWYDDLWCLKYLPKFKWHHLTEQIGIFPFIISETEYFSLSECLPGGETEK